MGYKRERRINTRINGLELQILEQSGLTNSQIVRYGIRKYYEEHPLSVEAQLLVEIGFLQDKITEKENELDALKKEVQEKVSMYTEIRDTRDSVRGKEVAMKVYDLYLDFSDNTDLTDEFRSDLTNFYSYCYDGIALVGLKHNMGFDDVISVFEGYLEFVCGGVGGVVDGVVS